MIEFKHWNEYGIRVGFTERTGGLSTESFSSLNLGLHVSDEYNCVIENRKLMCTEIGVPFEAMTFADQVHGVHVHVVGMNERGRGRLTIEDALAKADVLVTKEKDILLSAVFADCVPLWFADHEAGVIAVAHAGWRGTVAGVAKETIRVMIEQCGARLERIEAIIGPSIGGCCYEVDQKVADAVMPWLADLDENTIKSIIHSSNLTDRLHLDLKQLNRQIIISIGVSPKVVTVSSDCTSCDTARFYSHRAEHGRTGRMAGWIIRTETEVVT